MPVYDRPTKELMREWAAGCLKKGEQFSKIDAVEWFKENYPKIKPGTVEMHVEVMSTNNGRIRKHHKSVYAGSGHDLFFKIGPNRFRLADPTTDPEPIYDTQQDREEQEERSLRPQDEETIVEQLDDQTLDAASQFAYERDLQNFLVKDLERLETGLRLYREEDDDGLVGVEFVVGGRRIDILGVDAEDRLVVIELKVGNTYDRVAGQLARYMGWIKENFRPEKEVRGIIVANKISDDLRLACSMIENVDLVEYEINFNVRRIK
ncbi:endonuclease NucS domain-containing protein [Mameliella sediminis]|uniref:endonuclease NucS domain-containing protein n=1 Tax=Mameliella sediminis TaxID=2836866 RepID=UPI001C470182|nr:endonuclease NucS domain-containing protein [Mameliella sediminis]MBV7394804.1 DUF91 domain-containing protein [Mameliella sediminis]MBY6113506.1 DUF91 domain-containing protein [Antarctobacter heliothermus]MBY6143146.1 DUF91 domain-containing protein [Mameliella alba]MCA0953130.1 endonuclease NucS [Mameliella alba]